MSVKRPQPPVEAAPPGEERASAPEVTFRAGQWVGRAKGLGSVYAVMVTASIAMIAFRIMPAAEAIGTKMDRFGAKVEQSTQHLDDAARVLGSIAADAHHASESAGRIESTLPALATKADIEQLRAEVRQGCPGRRVP